MVGISYLGTEMAIEKNVEEIRITITRGSSIIIVYVLAFPPV